MDFIFFISIIFFIIIIYYYLNNLNNEKIYCNTSNECPYDMYCKTKSYLVLNKIKDINNKSGRCYKKLFT